MIFFLLMNVSHAETAMIAIRMRVAPMVKVVQLSKSIRILHNFPIDIPSGCVEISQTELKCPKVNTTITTEL